MVSAKQKAKIPGLAWLAAACALAACGCSSPRNRFVEGTEMAVGMSIPNGSSWSLQLAEWMSGAKVSVQTNVRFKVERETSSSNSWFGAVHSHSAAKTTVETGFK